MRLIDLDQKIIVPIRDDMAETVYEVQMTVGEFFDEFLEGNTLEIVDAIPVKWLRNVHKNSILTREDMEFRDWLIERWHDDQEAR